MVDVRDLCAARVSVDLPADLAAAVRAEATRRCVSVSGLLREVLAEVLPDFVAASLRRDLAPIVETSGRTTHPRVTL